MPQKGGCPQITAPAGFTAVVPPGSAADSSPAPDRLSPGLGTPHRNVDLDVGHRLGLRVEYVVDHCTAHREPKTFFSVHQELSTPYREADMSKMLAALYNGVDTFEIKRIERLDPGPGDAVVKVRAEGICGSDLNQYRKTD